MKKLYINRLISQDLPHIDELILDLKAQPDLVVTKCFRTSALNGPTVTLRERIPTFNEIIARVWTNL